MEINSYGRIGVLLISTLVCIICFNSNVKNPKLRQWVALPSSYSLGIFCLNPLVIILLKKTGFSIQTSSPLWQMLTPFLTTAAILFICLGISYLLARTKLKVLVK